MGTWKKGWPAKLAWKEEKEYRKSDTYGRMDEQI